MVISITYYITVYFRLKEITKLLLVLLRAAAPVKIAKVISLAGLTGAKVDYRF